jgi:hypothetical protein
MPRHHTKKIGPAGLFSPAESEIWPADQTVKLRTGLFSGEVAEFVRNGLKILKIFRQSQQSTLWQIRDPATVDFSRES